MCVAVEALGLVGAGQAEEEHDHVGVRGERDGLVGEPAVVGVRLDAEARGEGDLAPRPVRRPAARRAATSTRVGFTCELPAPW